MANTIKLSVAKIVFSDEVILETIRINQFNTKFVIREKNGNFSTIDQYIDQEGNIFTPLFSDGKNQNNISLPSNILTPISNDEMLKRVRNFIHKYVDLDPVFEEIAAYYVLFTWVYDKFDKTPFLRIIGPWGSGKSRFLDTMGAICYHAINLGTGITPAPTYRLLEQYSGGTLIFDEANFNKTSRVTDVTQILNGSYSSRGIVTRCSKKDNTPEAFISFGPKIFAAQIIFDDDSLETRIISYITHETEREDIPLALPREEEWIEAEELRNHLLGFRLDNFYKIDLDKKYDQLRSLPMRYQEIWTPIFQAVGLTEIPEFVVDYIRQNNEERSYSLQTSHEGLVLNVLLEFSNHGKNEVYLKEICKRIFEINNIELTPKRVGNILSMLGFRKERQENGYFVILDDHLLNTLAKKYHFKIS